MCDREPLLDYIIREKIVDEGYEYDHDYHDELPIFCIPVVRGVVDYPVQAAQHID